MDNNKKNNKILAIFKKMKEISDIEYPDEINPNEYTSVEQFIRVFTNQNHGVSFGTELKEKINVCINSHKYGIVTMPASKLFEDNVNDIYKLSKMVTKMEPKVKGWVLDLRSNTGGRIDIFSLFALIFIPQSYDGVLWTIMKSNNDILAEVSVYNNSLFMRYKYTQHTSVIDLEGKLFRVGNDKKVVVLVDQYSYSGSEFVCLILKSFGAKIYGDLNKSGGALNLTAGYLVSNDVTMFFPNAFVYDKNNLKHYIYLETSGKIKDKFFLP